MSERDPICGDVFAQDGFRGRCRLEPGHDPPHEGLSFRAATSEIADLCWIDQDDPMAEHTEMWGDEFE